MIRSRLAQARVERGVTQEELARLVGISLKSLTRLEQGRIRLPPLAWYVNCALALGCERLDEVLGAENLEWRELAPHARRAPGERRELKLEREG
jgi:transcriptional regulator with XRE-family HTH domain